MPPITVKTDLLSMEEVRLSGTGASTCASWALEWELQ